MIPSINPLVLNLKESATLLINNTVKEMRAQGRDVAHFGFGQAAFPVPELLVNALRDNAGENSYLPTQGLLPLREAFCEYMRSEFGLNYTPGDVFVGPGSKELIFQISYMVEGVLLAPAPSWVSYGPQATLRGKKLIPIETQRENSYKLTARELDQCCHSLAQEQKLLILNNPGNPTGSVYSADELREIADICRAYNVLVISDEIYAKIDFTGRPHASISTYYPEGTIVSTGLSKSFAAGGYRVGMMVIPETLGVLKDALKSVISETFSAVSAPMQYAALAAYSRFDELKDEINLNTEIYKSASRYLWSRFLEMDLNCPKPQGAFYLFPDFENFRPQLRKKGILTGIQLSHSVLEEKGVGFLPGSDFYFPATNLGIRVCSVDFNGKAVRDKWPGGKLTDTQIHELFPNLVMGCDRMEAYLRDL
ncbi:MAG: aminotransferase class I/II-fold pyridoxal phosphate-dependent enzyme [Spirochaetales bacterium]|nr:aminotransferase class I/II-fold pyridoxal phosphate-dependent enzyme [Spirochaetales bacterium]